MEQGDIAVVEMHHGKANALDVAFCDALTLRFQRLRETSSRAVVLTGQGKMFSAGVDLPQMVEAGVPYIREFLPALHRLYDTIFNFPKPVVAAINGHAIAGGCILACCADHRLMAQDGGRMGVTEILVGVPFPPLAFEVMRSVTAPQYLAEAILTGATVAPDEAVARGWVNALVPREDILSRAVAAAEKLAAVSPAAFAMGKRQLRQPATERLAASGAALDAEVTEIWIDIL
ncbi:MAG: enoyl-CoA hydratase/isomerase family protein [Proteobacteria bacterium]|nr:enoyl-CoA hydratase/isomerase family protein [Pseudomonadota bacterium]